MMSRCTRIVAATLSLVTAAGCLHSEMMNVDPATVMIAQIDQSPPEKRPPNWEVTKALMLRKAPQIGDVAPDFTVTTADGKTTITRSKFQAGRPLVIVFGSFT